MKNLKKYFNRWMCLCLSSLLISSAILSKSDVKALDFDMMSGASFFTTFSSVEKQKKGFPGVIGVGATWKNGRLAEYSNESSAVDIVAPGGYSNGAQILVAAPTTMVSKGYRYSEGTSYATPLVAGTIAMMMSINCTLTPAQYLSRLQNRSTSTANGRKTNKKFKVLNAGKAVALMEEK